jgi:hypothetical protein
MARLCAAPIRRRIQSTKRNGPKSFGLRSEKKVEKPRGDDLLSTIAAAEIGP